MEANVVFVPADRWTVSGAVGRQWHDVSGDYAAWNRLTVDVRYHDLDAQQGDARVTAGLAASF